jgi:hypothetical protein
MMINIFLPVHKFLLLLQIEFAPSTQTVFFPLVELHHFTGACPCEPLGSVIITSLFFPSFSAFFNSAALRSAARFWMAYRFFVPFHHGGTGLGRRGLDRAGAA